MDRDLDPRSSARSAFGFELLKHRKDAGLSQASLAKQLNCDQSLVSLFERAERVPQRDHAVLLDRIFGVTEHKVFVGLYDRIVRESRSPRWATRWAEEIEPHAMILRTWDPLLVPGLLQIEDYARHIFATSPSTPPDRVEEQVQVRIQRRHVFEKPDPPAVWHVIDEGVLHRPLGGVRVHIAQLRHLLEMSQLPGVAIQIVPISAACVLGMMGAFALAQVLSRPDALLVESTAGGHVTTDPSLIVQHHRRHDTIRADAYPKGQSAQAIEEAIDKWSSQV